MTLRDVARAVMGDTELLVVGVRGDAIADVIRGLRPQRDVYPLWRGAAAWVLLGDDLDEYIDRLVLRLAAEQVAGRGQIAVYMRLKEEVEADD